MLGRQSLLNAFLLIESANAGGSPDFWVGLNISLLVLFYSVSILSLFLGYVNSSAGVVLYKNIMKKQGQVSK
jgi:hypothetical protein